MPDPISPVQAEIIPPKRKRPVKSIIAILLVIILGLTCLYYYNNFNRLLSDALMESFESSIASDVYELKFEKLRVDIFEGNLKVVNVVIQPREKPLRDYPYINSSFELKTETIALLNVEIWELLKTHRLILKNVSITKPSIQVLFTSTKPIFLPFKDSTATETPSGQSTKRPIDFFSLNEFRLIDASFGVVNAAKQREFEVHRFNIVVNDLLFMQKPGKDLISFKHVELSIDEFAGTLQKGPIRQIALEDFKIGIDSLHVLKTLDTITYHFDEIKSGLRALDIQTPDSLFHLTVGSFDFSYKEKSVKLSNLSFKPNISDSAMQKRFIYQHTQLSGAAKTVTLSQVDFDILFYHKKLFIDEIVIDKPDISIFKDNTKPVDSARVPQYFGQQIAAIGMPLSIKQLKATRVHLVNVERKRDSTFATVTLHRGTVWVKNITNLSRNVPLTISAAAYLEDKVHFSARLDFSYRQPQFALTGKLEKINLPDLNPIIQAYTPANINTGTSDEISFSGEVNWTGSTGTMTFLYRDLDVDLKLKERAKWKSSVLAFIANTVVHTHNPSSPDLPPRIVKFKAARDMHKGFVNILIKSLLSGVKETMIMSKENRKAYQAAKKSAKGK